MDKELRQTYNKQYYQKNRNNILTKLTPKVNCEFCNRKVSYANLNKHYTLPICKTTQAKNDYINENKIFINLIKR